MNTKHPKNQVTLKIIALLNTCEKCKGHLKAHTRKEGDSFLKCVSCGEEFSFKREKV